MGYRTRDYVRGKPKPTEEEALNFARSVMVEKGVDTATGPYEYADGVTLKMAKAALEKHAVDLSERLAFEMIDYALEDADLFNLLYIPSIDRSAEIGDSVN